MINIIAGSGMTISIFFQSIQQHFGLNTITPILLVSTISGLTSAIFLIFMGLLYDRFGPRLLLMISGLCSFVAGLILNLMMFQQSWDGAKFFWYSIGFINGIGFSASFISLTPTIMRWFPDRVSIASSILMASSNAAMALWPYLIVVLIEHIGVFKAYQFTLLITALAMFIGAAFLKPPEKRVSGSGNGIDINGGGIYIDTKLLLLLIAIFFVALSSISIVQLLAPILTESLVLSGIDRQIAEKVIAPEIMSIAGIFQIFSALI
ncbi:hypothetical protein Igag_1008 [Ignisphaera aggregans DSM 17230]|uniref:Major facilitator superfamily (MFS) profile domain-containing protein n=1 Tax=Ignisphaera aggregans (strain DSM 17230 / JCM 13409 / AQ1.S1) TaxID=583356 RepID=E0SNM7_IGNAA|nr:hypothetical protein Igag_1008 [Ignisphaera aggregans DSM 17230]